METEMKSREKITPVFDSQKHRFSAPTNSSFMLHMLFSYLFVWLDQV